MPPVGQSRRLLPFSGRLHERERPLTTVFGRNAGTKTDQGKPHPPQATSLHGHAKCPLMLPGVSHQYGARRDYTPFKILRIAKILTERAGHWLAIRYRQSSAASPDGGWPPSDLRPSAPNRPEWRSIYHPRGMPQSVSAFSAVAPRAPAAADAGRKRVRGKKSAVPGSGCRSPFEGRIKRFAPLPIWRMPSAPRRL